VIWCHWECDNQFQINGKIQEACILTVSSHRWNFLLWNYALYPGISLPVVVTYITNVTACAAYSQNVWLTASLQNIIIKYPKVLLSFSVYICVWSAFLWPHTSQWLTLQANVLPAIAFYPKIIFMGSADFSAQSTIYSLHNNSQQAFATGMH
jgi:hypothetical protein